ncbi:MAG: cation:proton antiporter, partial [Acidimicrobiales bacterium]
VHWLGHLSWPISFVLGTAVGPTDAVAATSIARRLGLPRRLLTILEGEALFNDATALVLYAAAVAAATTGHFSVLHTAGSIVYSAVVGGAIGLAVGGIGRWIRNRVDDAPIEIAGSMLLAYAAYLPAQAAHASGVLAAVTAGLYLGWHSSGGAFSARCRLQSTAFWETLVFLVNAALFVLVGLSFHTFSTRARGPLERLVVTGAAVVGAVVVLRLVWMWAFAWLIRPKRTGAPGVGGHPGAPGVSQHRGRERLVLGWSGMRGAITLAALLAVPAVTNGGQPLGGRDDVIYYGFAVIVVTLVVQGLTLPTMARRLGLREHPSVADTERQARLDLARAALDHLGRACDAGELPEELADGLRAQYLARVRRLETMSDDDDSQDDSDRGAGATVAAEMAMRQELIALQRRALIDMRDRSRIGLSTVRTIERDLDLEEARLHPV